MSKSNQVIEWSMSKAKWVIAWIERWANVIGLIIAVIALIYTILPYYNGSDKVTSLDFCNGFLVNDPSSYVVKKSIPSKKEKDYLESKINCYRDQIQKNPNDALAYTNIGEAERRLGNWEAARNAHQKALELKPELPETKIGLALVEEDMGNRVAAHQAIQGVLSVHPTNAIAHFYQGTILYAQHELNDAEVAWQKAKDLDPKLPKLVKTWRLSHLTDVSNWRKNEQRAL